MKKAIVLKDLDAKREICRIEGVTPTMLGYALHFERNSAKAVEIRKMAMEHGGICFVEKKDWTERLIIDKD